MDLCDGASVRPPIWVMCPLVRPLEHPLVRPYVPPCPLVRPLLHPMVRPYVPPLGHVSVSASVRTSIGASVRPPLWFILSMYCTEAHFAGGTYGRTDAPTDH